MHNYIPTRENWSYRATSIVIREFYRVRMFPKKATISMLSGCSSCSLIDDLL